MKYILNLLKSAVIVCSLLYAIDTHSQAEDSIIWYPYYLLDYNLKKDTTKKAIVFFYDPANEWCARQLEEQFEDQEIRNIVSESYVAIIWNTKTYGDAVFYKDKQYTYDYDLGYHLFFNYMTKFRKGTPFMFITNNDGDILMTISGFTKARLLKKHLLKHL